MKNNPINKGVISEDFKGTGPISERDIHHRAAELSEIDGRVHLPPTDAEVEQAQRELTGGEDIDAREAAIDALPESERWDPVPGSKGFETPGGISEDMDDEGRSMSEQMVEQGVEEAEHDQMLQAAKAAEKTDREDA